jgi:hypothetical protein
MTMYGVVNVSLHSFLTSYQIEVSDSQIHAPTALPLEDKSQVSTEWVAGLVQGRLDTLECRPQYRHCKDWAIVSLCLPLYRAAVYSNRESVG